MNLLDRFKTLLNPVNRHRHHFAELSSIGDRASNQDFAAHLFSSHGKLFIVADGLGGHKGGELASRYFCESFISIARDNLKKLRKQPQECLLDLVEQASQKMGDILIENHPGIDAHTTCAIAWLSSEDQLTTLHIGDTRIYWFTATQLLWRSRDHSVVQTLVDTGVVDEKQMGTHPTQSALTRSIAIGRTTQPSFKVHTQPMEKGQALLLCTDGFWEMVTQNEILGLARSKKLEKDLGMWVKTAISRARHSDNVTAQLYIR